MTDPTNPTPEPKPEPPKTRDDKLIDLAAKQRELALQLAAVEAEQRELQQEAADEVADVTQMTWQERQEYRARRGY